MQHIQKESDFDPAYIALMAARAYFKNTLSKFEEKFIDIELEDLVSPAWFRIDRELKRGIKNPKILFKAGIYGIKDYLREVWYSGGYGITRANGKAKFVFNVGDIVTSKPSGDSYDSLYGAYEPVAKDYEADEMKRKLKFWGETKHMRKSLSMQQRLVMYLYHIESVSQEDIANIISCSPSNINLMLSRAENICYLNGRVELDDYKHLIHRHYFLKEDGVKVKRVASCSMEVRKRRENGAKKRLATLRSRALTASVGTSPGVDAGYVG